MTAEPAQPAQTERPMQPASLAETQTKLADYLNRPELRKAALVGLLVALGLIVLALIVPKIFSWAVHIKWFPPLRASWLPRVGPGTPAAVLLATLGVLYAERARLWRWGWLMAAVFGYGLAWMLALATVDGIDGISEILNHKFEYLRTAREVTDFGATLQEFISRIPRDHPDNWAVHVSGHPPGALGFFVVLVRLGLGSGLAAGLVVTVIGASTAVAVLLTAQRLGAENFARRAAVFLTLGSAAIWIAVSADGMFAAFAAWGMFALAASATSARRHPERLRGRMLRTAGWGILAGLLLGYCVMLSYGLPLLAVLAVTILFLARSWQPLPWAILAALTVVLAFIPFGYAWWHALPVLTERYWDGVASSRPPGYWTWANFSLLAFSAGPLVGSAVGAAFVEGFGREGRARHRAGLPIARQAKTIVALALAGFGMALLADISQMSRAEVERIWLPFVPWMLLATALLPERWRRPGLIIQLSVALVVQHLLLTDW